MDWRNSRRGEHTKNVSLQACILGPLMLLLASCTSDSPPNETPEPANQPLEVTDPATPVTGEVPEGLMNAIIEDLVKNQSLNNEHIEVERAESVIWPDGALGCPEPGVMYTQAQVQGYWVVLRAGGRQFDYRASGKGLFRRCKGSFRLQLPVG